mgnify:CR=1 FL=1
MLLATGEQISVALCAMALEAMGLPCVSLTAWQVGIQSTTVHSDARIRKSILSGYRRSWISTGS